MENKGFTLIELIVVMAIIAILVLLAAPRFLGYTKDANVTAMIQDTKVLTDAANVYHIKNEEWPIRKDIEPLYIGKGGVDDVYHLDRSKMEDSIKNIEGDYDEYGLVIDGDYSGDVIHLTGIENSKGEISLGSKVGELTMDIDGYYTKNYIDSLLKKEFIEIATAEDFNQINENPSASYVQVANIDGKNIEPVEDFTGIYLGGNHHIENLNIEVDDSDRAGLFKWVRNGTVADLKVTNANVTGEKFTGAVVGRLDGSTIHNISVSGNVKGTSFVGGLIGRSFNSTIYDSSANVTVNGNDNVGGLIGQNRTTDVYRVYSLGQVEGHNLVGGLIGANVNKSTLEEAFSESNVTAQGNTVGGLIGNSSGHSKVTNTYSSGSIHGSGERSYGGLIGQNSGESYVYDSYSISPMSFKDNKRPSLTTGLIGWNYIGLYLPEEGRYEDTSWPYNSYFNKDINNYLGGDRQGVALNTQDMKLRSTYKEWDKSTWKIANGRYPELRRVRVEVK